MIETVDERVIREAFGRLAVPRGEERAALVRLVREQYPLLDAVSVRAQADRLHAVVAGLGALDRLLLDDSITDILVNGPGPVWIERSGRLELTEIELDETDLAMIVERAFASGTVPVDRAHPIGDARLPGGERISAVLAPIALGGTHLALRRFATRGLALDAFADAGLADRLRRYVDDRANIVVFGPTGAGKTSLLNALAATIPHGERIVTIEDAAELRIDRPHVVRLECRSDNGDGAGRVDLRALVRAALRLRPDRLVIGEVRGPEALDMIWAMATGHDGSLSTCHARSAVDALERVETFVMLADAALPFAAVRAQVRAAIDVVIGVERRGAQRIVSSVHEVVVGADGVRLPDLVQVHP